MNKPTHSNSRYRPLLLSLVLLLLAPFAQGIERITYYHNDHLGSPVAATDSSGNVVWRESYQPYGSREIKQGDNQNSLWYTGKQEESLLGVSYFGARWYDPEMGRFLAMDPVGVTPANPHSFNRYAYANNNPYRFVDPDGRIVETAAQESRSKYGKGTSGKGHHWVPFGSLLNEDISITAREVFGQAVSGEPLPDYIHCGNCEHTRYSSAVKDELFSFAKSKDIDLSVMTREEANDFVNHIRGSDHPDIKPMVKRIDGYTSTIHSMSGGRKMIFKVAVALNLYQLAEQVISTSTAPCQIANCAAAIE